MTDLNQGITLTDYQATLARLATTGHANHQGKLSPTGLGMKTSPTRHLSTKVIDLFGPGYALSPKRLNHPAICCRK
jgi:hypothetical protein